MEKKHTQIIRVIAAVVDQQQLTLYKVDGETVVILQGDPRLAKIVRAITPVLSAGYGAVAEVDVSDGEVANPYRDFEEQNGTGIRFFQVAKSKLAGWLNKAVEVLAGTSGDLVPPMTIGQWPAPPTQATLDSPKPHGFEHPIQSERLLAITEEIIKHAKPSHHPEFSDKDTGDRGSSTIVAVVGNKIVSNVEKLKPQITRAVQTNSATGVKAFMTRVAAVQQIRRHPVEDLLQFLEKGDLPIANDGCIVIYKVLRRKSGQAGVFVDCHTGKVTQKVGSYVSMDEKLVDPNRSNECSNGLHVARRQYVGGFSGDVCVLAKVHPEDVIAVPDRDANKMRVCGYHILFELPNDAFAKLRNNKPFTDTEEAQILLGRALAGDHPQPIEQVLITEHGGGGVKFLPWITIDPAPKQIEAKLKLVSLDKIREERVTNGQPAIEDMKKAIKAKSEPVVVVPTEALIHSEPGKLDAPILDPKTVVKEVAKEKAVAESRRDKAQRLHADFTRAKGKEASTAAAQALLDHKKSVKLGWIALGLTEEVANVLQSAFK